MHLPKTHVNQVINQLSITFRGLTLCCLEGLSFSPLAQKAELQQVVCQSVMAYDGYVRLGFSNMKQRFTLYTLPLNMMLHVIYENISFNSSKHPRRVFLRMDGCLVKSCHLVTCLNIFQSFLGGIGDKNHDTFAAWIWSSHRQTSSNHSVPNRGDKFQMEANTKWHFQTNFAGHFFQWIG